MNIKAVGRTTAAIGVIVIVIIAAVGIYFMNQPSQSSTSSTMTSASAAPQTLVIDDSTWPAGDLNQLNSVYELPWPNWLAMTVYQPLVAVNATAQYGEGNIQLLPGLANFTISPDSTTYTFTLRPGVSFSNGDPFNAYQVWMEEYGFYYLSGNSTTWLESYDVFNMTPVKFGPATIALINQTGLINPGQQALQIMTNSSWPIYVTSPNQIVFHLKAPFAFLLTTLVGFDGLMFDTQFVLNHGGFGTPTTFNTYFNRNPIPGTGPYVVTNVSPGAYVQFTQNPNYWGSSLSAADVAANPILDPGHVKNVVVYYKPDDLSRYTDLSTGAAQIATIQFSNWNLITTNPQYAYLTMPAWSGKTQELGLNTHLYPTNITDVRLAIVHAINYTDLALKAYGNELYSWVGPEYGMWKEYYNLGGFAPYSYNLTLAKQYLAEANVTNMPTFLFRVVSSCDVCLNTAQVIQNDLSQLGINVNIQVLTFAAYLSPLGSFSTNVANAAQIGQLTFPSGGIEWAPATLTAADNWITFTSGSSLWGNVATYSNPIVQKCDDALTSSADATYIQSACTAAQAQIYKDAPYAWIGIPALYSPSGGSVVWKKGVIHGFVEDPLWTGDSDTAIFNTVTFGP